MTVGDPDLSQAELVGNSNANQFNDPRTGSNPGGTSQGIGFGTYNLEQGDSSGVFYMKKVFECNWFQCISWCG